jgi:hypothetical protein
MLDNILFFAVGAMGTAVYFLWPRETKKPVKPQQDQEKKDRNTDEVLPIIEDMYDDGMLNTGQMRAYSKAQHGGARLRANTKTLMG